MPNTILGIVSLIADFYKPNPPRAVNPGLI